MSSIGYILFLFDERERMTHHSFPSILSLFVLSNESDIYFYNIIKGHTLSEVIRVELGRKSIDHASKKEDRGGEEECVLKGRDHRRIFRATFGGALRRRCKNTTSAK